MTKDQRKQLDDLVKNSTQAIKEINKNIKENHKDKSEEAIKVFNNLDKGHQKLTHAVIKECMQYNFMYTRDEAKKIIVQHMNKIKGHNQLFTKEFCKALPKHKLVTVYVPSKPTIQGMGAGFIGKQEIIETLKSIKNLSTKLIKLD